MPALSDYTSGTITLTNGLNTFTGTGTGWEAADFREGDTILGIEDHAGVEYVIATIDGNGSGTLTQDWEGATGTYTYRMRYLADGARVTAQARNLIELLGNGNLQALAGLTGPGVPVFNGPHSMTVKPETDFINGVAYDIQVDTLADRAAYDGQSEGFTVLVSDVGDGRSALYSKNSNTVGDWSDPAYITGPIGPASDISVGGVTTLPPGSNATVAATPVPGGVELEFGIPRGATGDIDGVTPFWNTRLGSDVDAEAALVGLGVEERIDAQHVTRAPYIGLVAGPTMICDTRNPTNNQFNSRVRLQAREKITSMQLVYANTWLGTNGEVNGSTMVLAASVEYPRGTIRPCTWAGSMTSILAGGEMSTTEALDIEIPEGADFWVRSWQDTSAYDGGVIHRNFGAFPLGGTDVCNGEVGSPGSPITNKTAGGDYTQGAITTVAWAPIAVIGQASKETFLLIGDSRVSGFGSTAGKQTFDFGTVGPSIGRDFAYINASSGGDRAQWLVSAGAMRQALAGYVSQIILQLGINDIAAAATGAQVKTWLETYIASVTNPVYVTTLEPYGVTSSNSFVTLAGQTAGSTNAARLAHNATVRSDSIVGAVGYFDIADAFESTRDSGLWKVNGTAFGYTVDGIHASQAGYDMLQDSGVIDPTRFRPEIRDLPRFASGSQTAKGSDRDAIVTPHALRAAGARFLISTTSKVAPSSWGFIANGTITTRRYSDGWMEVDIYGVHGPLTATSGSLFTSAPISVPASELPFKGGEYYIKAIAISDNAGGQTNSLMWPAYLHNYPAGAGGFAMGWMSPGSGAKNTLARVRCEGWSA